MDRKRNMRSSDWEILNELHRTPNLTKVAAMLFTTQPNITKRLQRMETEYDKSLMLREIFQPLLSVEESENEFLDRFKQSVADDGQSIILITGVGKAYPIVRSHTILNNLQSIFRKNPVVMMYPGRYEIKNAMTLRLFERLDDDNYYRAFPLVERRTGND